MARHQRAKRSSLQRRSFQFERLEDRLVMNAGNVVAAAIEAPFDPSQQVVAPPTRATAAQDSTAAPFPQQFTSEAEFDQWLLDAAVAQYGSLFGTSSYYPGWNWNEQYNLTAGCWFSLAVRSRSTRM